MSRMDSSLPDTVFTYMWASPPPIIFFAWVGNLLGFFRKQTGLKKKNTSKTFASGQVGVTATRFTLPPETTNLQTKHLKHSFKDIEHHHWMGFNLLSSYLYAICSICCFGT